MNAVVLFTVEVFGVLLRVLECQGKRWLCAQDIVRVFEYRSTDTVKNALTRHKLELAAHSIKARIDGSGQAVWMADENALRFMCRYSPRPGAVHLMHWLDEGGMLALPDDAVRMCSEKAEYVDVFEPDHSTDHAEAAISNSLPTSTQGKQLEHEKAYCRDLLKTMLRYCSLEDVDDVRTVLDDQIDSILRSRHCPGLNAARYELYRRYWIRDAHSANGQEVQS